MTTLGDSNQKPRSHRQVKVPFKGKVILYPYSPHPTHQQVLWVGTDALAISQICPRISLPRARTQLPPSLPAGLLHSLLTGLPASTPSLLQICTQSILIFPPVHKPPGPSHHLLVSTFVPYSLQSER